MNHKKELRRSLWITIPRIHDHLQPSGRHGMLCCTDAFNDALVVPAQPSPNPTLP